MTGSDRIGYTVVGGFLGSGKTTLINGMLATATERLAVIVNDLGDINVDASLIRSARLGPDGAPAADPGPDTIELTNGCVCCSIGDSLAATLRALCTGEAGPRRTPPNHVVLECSGAADPAAAAAYGSRRVLAEPTIIVAADATDIRKRADDPRFADLVAAQVQSADLIVVTKAELLTDVNPVVDWLTGETEATIVVGNPGALGMVLPNRARVRPENSATPLALKVETTHFEGPVTDGRVAELLAAIDGLVRAKGIVETPNGYRLIQWAAGRLISEPWSGPAMTSALVIIS